ncbi:hypothetical protein [Streptomyces sp. NPDC046371]
MGVPLTGDPGPWNAVTEVPGVQVGQVGQVGQVTLIEGEDVRTG